MAKMQTSKEQERHWRCGYEALFQKYTKLKEQLATRERDLVSLDHEHELKIKQLTRKAEKAVRFFKDIAFERAGKDALLPVQDTASEGRAIAEGAPLSLTIKTGKSLLPLQRAAAGQSTHQPMLGETKNFRTLEHRQSPIHKYLGRSKSANSSFVKDAHDAERRTLRTRPGLESPTRDHAVSKPGSPTARRSELIRIDDNENESRSCASPTSLTKTQHRLNRSTLSPRQPRGNADGSYSKHASSIRDGAGLASPGAQRRLASLDKLQYNIRDATLRRGRGLGDLKILIALDSMQSSFAEIAEYKQQTIALSQAYFQKTCQ